MGAALEYQKVQVWIHTRGRQQERLVLLLKTLPERGAFWQPVTGSVDPGEALEPAALREAREESGLEFVGSPQSLQMDFWFENFRGRAHEFVYALEARYSEQLKLDPREHVEGEWCEPEAALSRLKFESNAQALLALIDRWRRGG